MNGFWERESCGGDTDTRAMGNEEREKRKGRGISHHTEEKVKP